MNQITIPSITIDTPLPYTLNLRAEGQPLHGLHFAKYAWSRLTEVRIWENRAHLRSGVGEVLNYTVRTTGLTPQTKREKRFHVTERAAMVAYVNEWIAKTVERGLKEMAAQKAEKEMRANSQRRWIAHLIEKAGGVEERRQAIVREGHILAAKEAFQYESPEVFFAIITAITHGTPVLLKDEDRTRLLTRQAQALESWSIKHHIDSKTQELDAYLNEGKTEEVA